MQRLICSFIKYMESLSYATHSARLNIYWIFNFKEKVGSSLNADQ